MITSDRLEELLNEAAAATGGRLVSTIYDKTGNPNGPDAQPNAIMLIWEVPGAE